MSARKTISSGSRKGNALIKIERSWLGKKVFKGEVEKGGCTAQDSYTQPQPVIYTPEENWKHKQKGDATAKAGNDEKNSIEQRALYLLYGLDYIKTPL